MTAVADPDDVATSGRSGGTLRRAGRALREPAYRWWFGSQVMSSSGTMTQGVAQSWLILQMTGRAFDLGLLSVVTWAPVLLGGAWAGAVVDRVDRRRLLAITQAAFIVLCTAQAILIGTGAMRAWMIFAFGLAGGVVTAIDGPARQVYVLELVGRDHLASAVGLNEVVLNAARIFGPAIGGVLLATVGAGPCFAVNAASYLPVLFLLARYRPRPLDDVPVRGPRPKVADGLRAVAGDPAIGACMLIAIATGMLFNLGVAVPVLARQTFHLGGGGYGALMAAFGIGAVPGAIAAASTSGHPTGTNIRRLSVVTTVLILLTAAAPGAIAAFVGIAVAGFFSIWLIAIANTLVQLRSRPEMRGLVMGVWTMALPGSVPVTGMIAALVGQVAGGRAAFGLSGAALLVVCAVTWRRLGSAQAVETVPASTRT
jgi:MFS family permease